VIVGGALAADNAEVYHAVLEARQGAGPFCVLPTASGVPEESMRSSVERFTAYAADARYAPGRPEVTGVWITTDNPEAALDPATVAQLEACSGYWFVGGSQSRIVQTFRPDAGDTPAYRALMQRWREGAVVSGTSAGAAMMSSRSIGSGSPAAALAFGITRDDDEEGLWVMEGMEFVPWAILGQHHLARGRWGRLVVATLEEEDWLGLGIDENTAIVYEDGVGTVLGASGVLVIDVSGATPGSEPRTATGIRLDFLAAGDRVDVRTGAVERDTQGKVAPPPLSLDGIADEPFGRWALLRVFQDFAAGSIEEFTANTETHTLVLRRAEGFIGLASPEGGATLQEAGTRRGLTVGPLTLDVVR
jgi:cyanophycinase